MRIEDFEGYDNIISSQEYVISTTNNNLLMTIYNTPSLYIESFLYSEKDQLKYINNIKSIESGKYETHSMNSDRIFTIDQYREYLNNKEKQPVTYIYSYDNARHKDNSQFYIKIPNRYKNVDIDIYADKTDKIIKHDNFLEVMNKKFYRVNYISMNQKGYFQINSENGKVKFSNIVIKGRDVYRYESGKVLRPNNSLFEKIMHLATLPESINVYKNDIRNSAVYIYYDSYGIANETSDGIIKYECYLTDKNNPTDIISLHPLYVDQFDGSNSYNSYLWVVERLNFSDEIVTYYRNIYKCGKDKTYKLKKFLKEEAVNIDYPILELINFEELFTGGE